MPERPAVGGYVTVQFTDECDSCKVRLRRGERARIEDGHMYCLNCWEK